jgi:hypothetical protein
MLAAACAPFIILRWLTVYKFEPVSVSVQLQLNDIRHYMPRITYHASRVYLYIAGLPCLVYIPARGVSICTYPVRVGCRYPVRTCSWCMLHGTWHMHTHTEMPFATRNPDSKKHQIHAPGMYAYAYDI